MDDRDSLQELFSIVSDYASLRNLPLTALALPFMQERFGMGCDVYYRRRLSVCRTLIDLDLPIEHARLDTLLAVTASHYLPLDIVPADQDEIQKLLFENNAEAADIFRKLKSSDPSDDEAYNTLMQNRYALLIRLAERSVLVESLYEWPVEDARRYISETRRYFAPMAEYAMQNYSEFLGALTILREKTRCLVAANEALLNRYEEIENPLLAELEALEKENAALRAEIEKRR